MAKKNTATLEITSVKIFPYESKDKSATIKAFASITLGDCFAINSIRVVKGSKGLFVAMPSQYSEKEKNWYDICFPVTAEFREVINDTVLEAYKEEIDK